MERIGTAPEAYSVQTKRRGAKSKAVIDEKAATTWHSYYYGQDVHLDKFVLRVPTQCYGAANRKVAKPVSETRPGSCYQNP